jgi:acyl dehydratase
MTRKIRLDDLERLVGQEIGVSDWVVLDQPTIDAFADVTRDHQFIHVDPVAAAASPFGGTIAHGFLTLSMLSYFAETALPVIADTEMGVNYGFDTIRFLAPVPSGSRIRARFVLKSAALRGSDRIQNRYEVTVEIDGSDKPALVAEWITLAVLSAAATSLTA